MTVSRRALLRTGAIIGGGLLLELELPMARAGTGEPTLVTFKPNAYLSIGSDGVIRFTLDRVEMGQGVATAAAQLLAEELEVDPLSMQVELAGANRVFDNLVPGNGFQVTGGSTSTVAQWPVLRQAGATARELLKEAAAQTWGVPRSECTAENGTVLHKASGKVLRYGELAAKASTVSVSTPQLKTKNFKVIGKPINRVDAPAKVDGSAVFGIDVKVPDALVAVVVRCPVAGGTVKRVDDTAAKAKAGVSHIVQISNGVAVVAKTYWHARQAANDLTVEWDEGPFSTFNSATLEQERRDLVATGKGVRVAERGDVKAALAQGAVVEAEYTAPYLAHAPMEPQNTTAHAREDGCDIWSPTQTPGAVHETVCRRFGWSSDKVVLHQTWVGGGFGRRLYVDMVVEAVEVSVAIKGPVKVVWSREDDVRHDVYRPATSHFVKGSVGADGQVLGWHHQVVNQSLAEQITTTWTSATLEGAPNFLKPAVVGMTRAFVTPVHFTSFEGVDQLPYEFPHFAVDYHRHENGVPIGFWRSVGHSHSSFATESFVDELAAAAKKDPYEFRRSLLTKRHRHRWVLELAAEKAGWGTPLPEGRARGIAVHRSFESYAAAVAEVSVDGQRIVVKRLVLAVDCGRVVNPQIVCQQMESAAIFGLSAALKQRITFEKGRVQQSNFHDFESLRMAESPQVECHIRFNEAEPTGIGEPAVPVIAPAVANAVFALTGLRLRSLPLTLAT